MTPPVLNVLTVWGPAVFSSSTVLYDIALTGQCRLSEGRKQSLTELTAFPSCYRIYSSVPLVNIPLSSQLCYVTSNRWRCQCHVPTNLDLLLYTKAMPFLRQPFTARPSGRPPVALCGNRSAATAVPTVCSEQASILRHISAFICCFWCQ